MSLVIPVSSVPCTIFASTIGDPIFGFNKHTGKEDKPHQVDIVDMMTIDNLPNELPRDASKSFGEQFIKNVLGEYQDRENSTMLERASVSKKGDLGSHFEYLRGYLNGES